MDEYYNGFSPAKIIFVIDVITSDRGYHVELIGRHLFDIMREFYCNSFKMNIIPILIRLFKLLMKYGI